MNEQCRRKSIRRTTSNCLGVAIVAAATTLSGSSAQAHFLFIRLGEPAEGGRRVEVFFSERAAAGDPRFIAKTAPTTLSMQASPGEFERLSVRKAADRLVATLPKAGPASITGFLEYGVLKREVPFLLRYYPKAVAGDPKALSQFKRRNDLSLEIDMAVKGEGVSLALLRDGKPIPQAVFTTVDDDLVNEELKADASGKASWKPPAPGYYCVYAKSVLNTPGERNGSRYVEIREFATIAFRWPLDRHDADPAAVALFQNALASRATWDHFPGFSAELTCSVDGRQSEGKARVSPNGEVSVELDDAPTKAWVERQIQSLVMHRLPAPKSEAPVLRFADADMSHPLGRLLVFEGGEFASSYRVADGQIRVVNRAFGGENMTIVVLEAARNAEGKELPRCYTVQYWDGKSGDLARTEAVSNRWTRVGRFDLPASATVTTSSNAGLSVRSIVFAKHQLSISAKK